jgi:hypothetical protein
MGAKRWKGRLLHELHQWARIGFEQEATGTADTERWSVEASRTYHNLPQPSIAYREPTGGRRGLRPALGRQPPAVPVFSQVVENQRNHPLKGRKTVQFWFPKLWLMGQGTQLIGDVRGQEKRHLTLYPSPRSRRRGGSDR